MESITLIKYDILLSKFIDLHKMIYFIKSFAICSEFYFPLNVICTDALKQ